MQAGSVEQPLRLPLVAQIQNRSDSRTKDARLINVYVEKDLNTEEYWVFKRPGCAVATDLTGAAGGTYNWNGDIYAVAGTTLYKNGVSIGTVAASGQYQFTDVRGVTPYLVLNNGTNQYYTNGTTVSTFTDPNFPTNLVPGWAYLDGTLYVMDRDAQIWGSQNLDDPLVWDPLNKIIARVESDKGICLAKQAVYVIAFKQYTTEAFYDAANEAGSPLAPVQGAKVDFGCAAASTVRQMDGALLWVTNNRAGSQQVALMNNLQLSIISTQPIERQLSTWDFTQVQSSIVKVGGHKLYSISSPADGVTLTYDLDQQIWYEWHDAAGTGHWPFVGGISNTAGQVLVQHATAGDLYYLDTQYTYPSDAGALIRAEIYTPNFDGGVSRVKHFQQMYVQADQTNVSDFLYVRWSDDDYQSWGIYRSFDLRQRRPSLPNCGSAHRRAFNFYHQSLQPLRLKSVSLVVDVGAL
ncbi:MAG: hypothetical protein SFV24_19095 [Gemmatimonadales bacterium]|nr:hypothetical protein [Gemmatimonadales bacterium]